MEFKLYAVVNRILNQSAKLEKGEAVCIVTDTNTLEIGEVFAACATAMGAEPVLVTMNPTKMHGAEPPAIVAAAMKAANIAIHCVTHAISHTNANKEAREAGTRMLVMRGITKEIMLHGAVNADYEEIYRVTKILGQKMSEGKHVKVSTPSGTNLTFSMEGRDALVLGGIINPPRRSACMPDGESATVPLEGTTEGTLVIDHTMDGVGLVDAPIIMQVEKGRVTKIEGGKSAEKLRRIIEEADEWATNIAEFAIGTNPSARLIGNMTEDKKASGTVHIAIGDSHNIGGTVESNIHLDGLLLSPTVWIDGECVVENGKLLIE